MIVCFIATGHPVDDTRIDKLRREVLAHGDRVIAIMQSPQTSEVDFNFEYHQLRPVHYFYTGGSNFNLFSAIVNRLYATFQAAVYTWRAHPDVCHCHEPDAWAVSILIKFLTGCTVVLDLHEVFETRANAFPLFVRETLRRVMRGSMCWMSNYTDYIIHVSQPRADLYRDFRSSTVVVNHYPDMEAFDVRAENDWIRENGLEEKFVVLHAGALRPNYAARQFLQAVDIARGTIPNLKCVVLGGTQGVTDSFQDIAENLQQEDVLQILAHKSFVEVVKYMQTASVGVNLVLPVDLAHQFAAPRKLFEYLAAGLPVIASDVPGIRPIFEKFKCGKLVDARDPRKIACAIIEMYQNNELHDQMAASARHTATTRLNWSVEKFKIREIYDQIAVNQEKHIKCKR